MKKVVWTVLSVLWILATLCLIASAEDVLQGEELSFTIHIDSYEGIKSGSIELSYDPDVFEATEGSWTLSPAPFVADFKTQDGKGVFLYASPVTVGGDVFQVTLRVKDTAPLEQSEPIVKVRVLNSAGESQWIEYPLGSYRILCNHAFTEETVSDAYLLSPATCTAPAVYSVSCRCGEKGTDTFTHGSPLGHAYDHDCDTACNRCGEVRTISHAYSDEYAHDAESHWQICTVCGHESEHHLHVSQRPCDPVCEVCGGEKPHAHEYSGTVTAPTCTEQGYTTYRCTYCGDTYIDDTTDAKGHTPGSVADCLQDQVCTVCGTVLVNKLGHDYDSVITQPTCTEKGSTTHTCTRCGDIMKEEIPALGHDPVQHSAQNATCTEHGWDAYETCSRCDHTTYAEIPATGHVYGDWTQTLAPTCERDGESRRNCTGCDHYETQSVEKTDHEDADSNGICDYCEKVLQDSETAAPDSEPVAPDSDTTAPDGDTAVPDSETTASDSETTDQSDDTKDGIPSYVIIIAAVIGALIVIGGIALLIHKLRYL